MSTLDTAALRALADAATPGPWSVSTLSPHIIYSETDCRPVAVVVNGETPWFNEADAELIAALHPDTVRALCDAADEAERLRKAVWASEEIDRRAGMLAGVQAERDASRTAHDALVAELRALHAPRTQVMSGSSDPKHVPMTRQVCSFCGDNYGNAPYPCATVTALDRHAPTTGATP